MLSSMLGKASVMALLSRPALLAGATCRPLQNGQILDRTLRLCCFSILGASQNVTKLFYLVVLKKASVMALLSHPALLTGATYL